MHSIVRTWYRAHPHGGSLDNADTESTGERNAPPVRSGEKSVIYNQICRHGKEKVLFVFIYQPLNSVN